MPLGIFSLKFAHEIIESDDNSFALAKGQQTMMENLIALASGLVVVGGLLSLVFRIMTGGGADQKLDRELENLVKEHQSKSQTKT